MCLITSPILMSKITNLVQTAAKMIPKGFPNSTKIVKIQVWIQRCPKRCPQARVTKMGAQGSKMEPSGCQEGTSGISNSCFSIQKSMPSRRQPINRRLLSRSAVDLLPVDKGAGGRGGALRYHCQYHVCLHKL